MAAWHEGPQGGNINNTPSSHTKLATSGATCSSSAARAIAGQAPEHSGRLKPMLSCQTQHPPQSEVEAHRSMVAASSSTKTATGSAPCARAAAPICRATAGEMLRLARGHRIMPIRLAPGRTGVGWWRQACAAVQRRGGGACRSRSGTRAANTHNTVHRTASPAAAAASASSGLVTPHTLMTGCCGASGRSAAAAAAGDRATALHLPSWAVPRAVRAKCVGGLRKSRGRASGELGRRARPVGLPAAFCALHVHVYLLLALVNAADGATVRFRARAAGALALQAAAHCWDIAKGFKATIGRRLNWLRQPVRSRHHRRAAACCGPPRCAWHCSGPVGGAGSVLLVLCIPYIPARLRPGERWAWVPLGAASVCTPTAPWPTAPTAAGNPDRGSAPPQRSCCSMSYPCI